VDLETALALEWLVTNGLGGYAMGTVAGVPTRGHHATLVAAGKQRTVLVQHLVEVARAAGEVVALSGYEAEGAAATLPDLDHLASFSLEDGVPTWRWRVSTGVLEKRVCMVQGANTTLAHYRWQGDARLSLEVTPLLHLRGHNQPLDLPQDQVTTVVDHESLLVFERGVVAATLQMDGSSVVLLEGAGPILLQRRVERQRGYGDVGPVLAPAMLWRVLEPGEEVVLVCAGDASLGDPLAALAIERARSPERLARAPLVQRDPQAATLVLAAHTFLIRGGHGPSVIAGYPWFGEWGRDTLIALEGLALLSGEHAHARAVLQTFARAIRDGLVPNHFDDAGGAARYNTADASLWFIHALARYAHHTKDHALVAELLPQLRTVFDAHLAGTRYGIGADPQDLLLRQGAPGLQLTWMDAIVGTQVITPRRGKAVEINALWYAALRQVALWSGDAALHQAADRVRDSFNRRFWCEARGHLFDVVDGEEGPDGDDASLRPNQLFAFSLPHPVLARERWRPVLEVVRRALWTPRGLRTLAPADARYRGLHAGDVSTRDAAYHNGTVWPWLLGAWVDAELAVDPQARTRIRRALDGVLSTLAQGAVGTVAEIFSGDPPHAPEGTPAQAWSVAELLRALDRLS
jgi:predicted glycogen debranching enzyme